MASHDPIGSLSPDKPLEDPKQDRLGYSNFARHISESICRMAPLEGFVISVYGSWGSGKSTLLNFLEYYLKQMPEGEQPIIMHFNPWWFSGHEDLTIRFFDQLQAELGKKKWIKDPDKLKDLISGFAGIISKSPIPDPLYIKWLAAISSERFKKQKNAPELKDKISNALRGQEKKILVIIDDIDRLTADEIRQLFRVIKSVADFPNVVYLLAFDKNVVVRSLDDIQGTSGEAYLEKIVQLPLQLPAADKIALRNIFCEKLERILADTPKELFDEGYFYTIYINGIDHFIETPRDIIRLTNALNATYPPVDGEVNPVDFIAIEALRVYCPFAYDIVRTNAEAFTTARDIFSRYNSENIKSFHNRWIEQIQEEDRDVIKRLFSLLFPRLRSVWGANIFEYESKLCVRV